MGGGLSLAWAARCAVSDLSVVCSSDISQYALACQCLVHMHSMTMLASLSACFAQHCDRHILPLCWGSGRDSGMKVQGPGT